MNKLLLTILMCFLITVTSCEEDAQKPRSIEASGHKITFDKDTFERERAAWTALEIHNYKVQEEVFWGGIMYGANFTVRGDNISSIEFISSPSRESSLFTVSKIYNEVADYYNTRLQDMESAQEPMHLSIDIAYNADYHYPTEVHCYYFLLKPQEETLLEGVQHGRSIWIKSFTALPPQ